MPDVLVCDTGPLIILAKLRLLKNCFVELGFETVVVDLVAAELRQGPFIFGEAEEIEAFIQKSKIVSVSKFNPSGESLSLQDQASLIYANAHKPAILFADDRLLRRAALKSSIQVIGFLGIMIQLSRREILSAKEVLNLVDEAIEIHQYRISISLYQALQKQL